MPNIVAGHLEDKAARRWTQRVRAAAETRWGVAAIVLLAAAMIAALAFVVSGSDAGEAEVASGPAPAVVEHPDGMTVARLRLTERAVQRVGIETATVRPRAGGGARRLAVPYGALLYDADGKTWVYTNPQPRVYVRAAVVVDRIDGETVLLSSGPTSGTKVVTVGAQELLGTEFEVDH